MSESNNLIQDWKNRKTKQAKAHKKLVKRLSRQKAKPLNETAENLHHQVFDKLDCLDCANCCTSIPPMLNRADIRRIAKHLNLKPAEFEQQYILVDNDGDKVMKTTPCPFLQPDDNKCSIYEIRPRACRTYPHTDDFQFAENLELQAINSKHCPAVFNILERMLKQF